MFERFTKDARAVVVRTQEEAIELGHRHIGTQHLLLALAQEDGPAARTLSTHGLKPTQLRARIAVLTTDSEDPLDAEALRAIGVDLDAIRQATEETFGEGALDSPRGRKRRGGKRHIPFTKGAKKSLELSLRHALRLKQNHIGTGHILLGVLHDENCSAVRLLKDYGVDIEALRADVTRRITSDAA